MSRPGWNDQDIPDLSGKRAVVTGVTSGLGAETARQLAAHGAEVVMAARNESKLDETIAALGAELPDASFVPVALDLADLSSVRAAAERMVELGPIDILVNNAGVMAAPLRQTVDGLELHIGTNHYGHFALTGLLLPALAAEGGARVTTVSSSMARTVRRVSLVDPRLRPERYSRWKSYGQSKLANLLFTFELDRRAQRDGIPIVATAAHPGYTHTGLVSGGLNMGRRTIQGTLGPLVGRFAGQSVEQGALPQLMAATAPGLRGGTYCGPNGANESRGQATIVQPPAPAHDEEMARQLWELSEMVTGVEFL
jgi:NAD(P)-dependent dehydrogenase (short-subunit alcohol dehydrogenase family)